MLLHQFFPLVELDSVVDGSDSDFPGSGYFDYVADCCFDAPDFPGYSGCFGCVAGYYSDGHDFEERFGLDYFGSRPGYY